MIREENFDWMFLRRASILRKSLKPQSLIPQSCKNSMSTSSASGSGSGKLRMGLCQVSVGADKAENISNVRRCIKEAHDGGAQMAVLPECWNSPYSTASFPLYAEPVPAVGALVDADTSPSTHMLVSAAVDTGMWIVGGSVPERHVVQDGSERLYNTCVVVNPAGEIVGKHRKVHLFDIDVPGRIKFKESDSLTGGDQITVVDTPWGGVGVAICYDMRFPELAIVMRQLGAKVLLYPGAFNMVTGPAHWELLQRARAVDNQCFVATCSPARDTAPGAGYVAWGHSTVVNPWGEVMQKAKEGQEVIFADLDLAEAATMRQNIPCWTQKRTDLYSLSSVASSKL